MLASRRNVSCASGLVSTPDLGIVQSRNYFGGCDVFSCVYRDDRATGDAGTTSDG
jgi:hypothetical protein